MVSQGNLQGHREHPRVTSHRGQALLPPAGQGVRSSGPTEEKEFLKDFGKIQWDLPEEALGFGCFFGGKLLRFFHLYIYL